MINYIDKRHVNIFMACFGLIMFLVFPLILAGRLYIDDIGRSVYGYLSWDIAGRPLADIVFKLLNLGLPAVNVFPLNQIISVALISVACVLLANQFKIKNPFLAAVATLPLGGQPYFLQNLSYAFDSVLMAGSMLLSVAAAVVLLRKTSTSALLQSFMLLLGTLTIYQPSINAFFIVYTFIFFIDSLGPEWNARDAFSSLAKAGILVATVFTVYMGLSSYYLSGDYANSHAEIIELKDMTWGIYHSLATYWEILSSDWKGSVLKKVTIITFAIVVWLIIYPSIKLIRRPHNILVALLVVFSLILLVIFSYGINLVLVDPVWMPRTFIGIGVALALLNLYIFGRTRQWIVGNTGWRMAGYILNTPVFVVGYALVSVAYAYGQSSLAQKDFDHMFLTRLLYDIDSVSVTSGINNTGFIGKSPRSPVLKNTARKYPIIDRLVDVTINSDHIWGFRLLNAYDSTLKFSWVKSGSRKLVESGFLKPARTTMHYSIYTVPEQLVVVFHEPDS